MYSSQSQLPEPFSGNYSYGGSMPGLQQTLSGIFGAVGPNPYKKGFEAYKPYAAQAIETQRPYAEAGTDAIGKFQGLLGQMSNPSEFINHLMGQYQESPWAKYQQQQAMHAAQNMGSATGLTGSTPLTQYAEQQAAGISSQDMEKWLQNVLGINKDTQSGYNNLIGYGQNAANNISQSQNSLAQMAGGTSYGAAGYKNNNMANILSGLGSMFLPRGG